MSIEEIRSALEAIERELALAEAEQFGRRAEALDRLEFHIIDRIDGLLRGAEHPEELGALRRAAERERRRLEAIDDRLFQRLRADIRGGAYRGAALQALIEAYVGGDASRGQEAFGYDTLDLFVNGLLLSAPLPEAPEAIEPEMVFYQKTPARIIFELIRQAELTEHDLFYDIGSGLGHVPILVNLLSGVQARGVEREPAYCAYARARAAELNCARVAFVEGDAREADYSDGTVFFMYTPFAGSVLLAALERLRAASRGRAIRLFTYGPCTPTVARQRWLSRVDPHGDDIYRLGEFRTPRTPARG
jgi:hypothetical protein